MDREADWFELLQSIDARGSRFVVRAMHDRRLAEPFDVLLSDALAESTWHETREVRVSRRRKGDRPLNSLRKHPPRETRLARLAISARSVTLLAPKNPRQLGAVTGDLRLQVVQVQEVEPPPDEDPVEWILLTNLPIASTDEVLRVVDIYRVRWMIEEFFKALKTGCAFERRQLESKHAILNSLALFVPLAWAMFALRTTARVDGHRSASEILSKRQTEVLRAMHTKPLPARLSVADALYAIAAIGGHLRNNGAPGWRRRQPSTGRSGRADLPTDLPTDRPTDLPTYRPTCRPSAVRIRATTSSTGCVASTAMASAGGSSVASCDGKSDAGM
jgi:hypothetical protein